MYLDFDDVKSIFNLPFDTLETYLASLTNLIIHEASMVQNLNFYLRFDSFQIQLKQELGSRLLYPSFLIILSFILTLFFVHPFAPSILEMLSDFSIKTRYLNILYRTVWVIKYIQMFLILSFIILIFFLIQKNTKTIFYIRFHHFRFMHLIRNYISMRFAFVYRYLLQEGLNTQEILMMMKKSEGISDIKWLAYHVEAQLIEGKGLIDGFSLSYFDPMFIIYLKDGYYTENLKDSLENYLNLVLDVIKAQAKNLIFVIKSFVYLYILFMIIIYYIFLFQPLSMMEAIL